MGYAGFEKTDDVYQLNSDPILSFLLPFLSNSIAHSIVLSIFHCKLFVFIILVGMRPVVACLPRRVSLLFQAHSPFSYNAHHTLYHSDSTQQQHVAPLHFGSYYSQAKFRKSFLITGAYARRINLAFNFELNFAFLKECSFNARMRFEFNGSVPISAVTAILLVFVILYEDKVGDVRGKSMQYSTLPPIL